MLLLVLTACTAPDPSRRGVECLAPAAAGGGWDLTCRVTGRILADLGLVPGAVSTVNMPGAGGGVAFAHAVAQRSTDPNVLIAASPATTLRLAQGQFGQLEADDVRWIGAIGAEYGIVAVAADAPWGSLRELLEDWARRPDEIVVSGGSAVVGQDHMKILLLGREAGIDPLKVRYVPFDGGGEALTALLGGFVQVFSGEASEVESHLETGSIRVLAVLAPEPLDGLLAGVPTANEQGYDVEWVTWRGFYVPGGLSDTEYQVWVDRLRAVGESEAWATARAQARLRPYFLVGEPFEAFVMRQVDAFSGLARELGLIQ
jgi:putative tricarboxylic transport membrane protein